MSQGSILSYVSDGLKSCHSAGPAELAAGPSCGGETGMALRILGLGPVQIYVGDTRITTGDLIYTKAQELLFYLLSYPRRTKAQIALDLWPDATPEYVQKTFRVVLYHLRRALGGPDRIKREQHSYVFNRQLNYWYDVESFVALVRTAKAQRDHSPEQAIASLEAACRLYQGDFWEGVTPSDWVIRQQESLQRLHVEALLALGDLCLASGRVRRALAAYLDAAEHDTYCEAAYRGAIRCYLALQEPAAAKSQYQRLSRYLQQDLGTRPSAQTQSLVESML